MYEQSGVKLLKKTQTFLMLSVYSRRASDLCIGRQLLVFNFVFLLGFMAVKLIPFMSPIATLTELNYSALN